MLEGEEAVVGQFSGIGMAVNPKDAAVVFRVVLHEPALHAPESKPPRWIRASPI
jgi:hypothetical protein